MQPREKTLLAILLGALGFWVLLPAIEGVVLGPFQSRLDRREELRQLVADKTKQQEELDAMDRQLMLWAVDSLPPDPLNAQRVYAEWLVERARLSGFRNIEPHLGNRTPAARVYVSIPVTLTAEATLRELATFLFYFDRARLLQRIIKCDVVSPETEGNPLLQVSITAEGLSLPDAPERARLFPRTVLTAPLDPAATQIEIESAASFPSDGPLRIRIEHEFLQVTRRDGARWTVQRGLDSTTAAEHPAGAYVEYAPARLPDPKAPRSIADYERLIERGPFVKPRPPVTYRPQLAPIANQTLIRGMPFSMQVKLSGWDPANGAPVYALDEFSPASMEIDADGNLSWAPAPTLPTEEFPVGVLVTSRVNPDVSLSTAFTITLREPNLPPRVTLPDAIPIAWIGRVWSLPLSAEDPDGTGALHYSITGQTPPGLTIDSATGVLRWDVAQTSEPGAVAVSVAVSDSGEPPQTTTTALNIDVQDDSARFTYLVGCLAEGEVWTAWLYDRSTNKSTYLKVGDKFSIADISGTVTSIDLTSMEFQDAEGRWRLAQEVPLRSAELRAPAAASSTTGSAIQTSAANDDSPIETAPTPEPAGASDTNR